MSRQDDKGRVCQGCTIKGVRSRKDEKGGGCQGRMREGGKVLIG